MAGRVRLSLGSDTKEGMVKRRTLIKHLGGSICGVPCDGERTFETEASNGIIITNAQSEEEARNRHKKIADILGTKLVGPTGELKD